MSGLLLLAIQLVACPRTTYRSYDDPKRNESAFLDRQVTYRLNPAIYSTLPQCVVVLAEGRNAPAAAARLAGPALARQLSGRLPRVIGPLQRRRLEKRHGVDLNVPGDRRHFARATGCKAYLAWRVLVAEENYFLVWSQRKLRIEAALHRISDDTLLWQAAHSARRSDGSVPLSPISVPVAAFEATSFTADDDVLPSMVDDVVRRLIVTLPDLR
ncbi:MAG: hypothetical protein R3229_11475 [Alphaproteobacteria bacterium]|nr:hypothetical protein [Alphaproteobacteria bacterium]